MENCFSIGTYRIDGARHIDWLQQRTLKDSDGKVCGPTLTEFMLEGVKYRSTTMPMIVNGIIYTEEIQKVIDEHVDSPILCD